MISICIPIFNFNVTALIKELKSQLVSSGLPHEIVLIDDCSLPEFKNENEEVCKKETYIQLSKNIGRARIRNLFLTHSKFDNLILLDCDCIIVSRDFVSKYIDAITKDQFPIICGGRIYESRPPARSKRLRWKYGKETEGKLLQLRKLSPNKSFMANNFFVKKQILEYVKFDERLVKYGHEDTLFGYRLKEEGIKIGHIDNPVLNGDIEENSLFLRNTESGVINLLDILTYVNYAKDFIEDVTLLKFYMKLKAARLTVLIRILFTCFKPLMKLSLTSGVISLKIFNFYKLGILLKYENRLGRNIKKEIIMNNFPFIPPAELKRRETS